MRPRAFLFFPLAFLGCSREEKRPERTEPWPAPSAAPSGSSRPAVRRASYALEKSSLDFELPAKRATRRGRIARATGGFDVDLENPERSSGNVRADLTSLELDDASNENSDGGATRRALDWLELGAGVAASKRDSHRYATFELRGLEGAEGKSLARLRARRDGAPPRLEAVAVGELSLHGVRAPARVPVSLEIDAGEDAPVRLVIRSRKPLVVSLGVHDIRPRDARGVLVARELPLLGENVGREAKVSFELTLGLAP